MNRIDFDDLLLETVALLETDADAAETVRARKRWFSVDEYQDTNPLQQRLLELWLGDREDVCVVGDEDQTIYTFTGATSDYLTGFATRHPSAREITLSRNYRSSPEILALANRLLAAEGRRKQLVATMPAGPKPSIDRFADADAELAHLVATIRRLVGEGIATAEIAILVRINAQIPPIEAALTKARIPFRVRGQRFFDRPEIRDALRLLRRLPEEAVGLDAAGGVRRAAALGARVRGRIEQRARRAGRRRAPGRRRASARPRSRCCWRSPARRSRRDTTSIGRRWPPSSTPGPPRKAEGEADGVNLLTLHRAKGLEWDAVLLPQLEDGTLPIRQAESDEELAEERRLLYVGLTRARRHLALSWAERRLGQGDRETRRRPERVPRGAGGSAGPPRHGPARRPHAGAAPRARRGQPAHDRAAGVAAHRGAVGWGPGVRHRPRRAAARDRRSAPDDDPGAAPDQGHGSVATRAVRPGDGRDRARGRAEAARPSVEADEPGAAERTRFQPGGHEEVDGQVAVGQLAPEVVRTTCFAEDFLTVLMHVRSEPRA